MRIAICIPRHGDIKGDFGICLARMLIRTLGTKIQSRQGQVRLDIEIFSIASSDLPESRTRLLRQAIEWRADYLLWLDADHVFPPGALLALLRHDLQVVGANYARRSEPTGPVAARINEQGEREHVWTTAELARQGAVEEVAHVGLGLCLMQMKALRQVKAHVEEHGAGWANWAPFDRKLLPGTTTRMGEDASFFEELRAAGVKIHVDHGLSWQVGHIGERVLTNADALAQKEAWLKRDG
ncbi:MAG: hypothetical protein ACFBQW_00285 [Sphingomonadaceae bacterium]